MNCKPKHLSGEY